MLQSIHSLVTNPLERILLLYSSPVSIYCDIVCLEGGNHILIVVAMVMKIRNLQKAQVVGSVKSLIS